MVAGKLRRAQAGNRKRKPARRPAFQLALVVRGDQYYASGTVRDGRRSVRVRSSLGLPALKDNEDAAYVALEAIEKKAKTTLGGNTPRSVAELVEDDISGRPSDKQVGATDLAILQDIVKAFGLRLLTNISDEEWFGFVDRRQAGRAASTRERYISTVVAFLAKAVDRKQCAAVPKFKRDSKARNPTTRARRPVATVRPALLRTLLDHSHISIRTQLMVEAETGARVSSVLHGCARSDLTLAQGAIGLTFRDTKPGFDVAAALSEASRPLLEEYLLWRKEQIRKRNGDIDREALFLAPSGRSYVDNRQRWGTQNKTAFNAAKRRAFEALRSEANTIAVALQEIGASEEATQELDRYVRDLRTLRALTQHWLRHKLATEVGRKDIRAAMRQGGWRDMRSVQGYLIDDDEYQRAVIETRSITQLISSGVSSAVETTSYDAAVAQILAQTSEDDC